MRTISMPESETDQRWKPAQRDTAFVERPEHKSGATPVDTISGSPEAAARKVESVSPEGRPAQTDAKSGPSKIRMEMLVLPVVTVIAAVGIGLWFGWVAGLVAVAVGALALLFNPVLAASVMRVDDRAKVVDGQGTSKNNN